ncbi:hypothetical protein [Bacillus toyonensis]|uniref:hypothetical protein n=1 Tax=Bacillus toyonensis TaxID=155322 RepID=UPI002E22C5CB|nr:hypothetical protein [Bacillus toyonensis]
MSDNMKTLFKQAHSVKFDIGEGAHIGCDIILEDKPLVDFKELQELAVQKLNTIYFAFDVILKESNYKMEPITMITIDDKEDPNYRVADWLFEDGRESDNINWNDYTDGLSGAAVKESEAEFYDVTDMLKKIEMIAGM